MTVGELAGLLERLNPERLVVVQCEWEGETPIRVDDGEAVGLFVPHALSETVDPDTGEGWAVLDCDQDWDEEVVT